LALGFARKTIKTWKVHPRKTRVFCPRALIRPMSSTSSDIQNFPAGEFRKMSIDDFTLLGDVANFEFRPMIIGKAAIVSGCLRRFKGSMQISSWNANHFHRPHLRQARICIDHA
jgi:hypothetical protein